jgi:hypothetical protein
VAERRKVHDQGSGNGAHRRFTADVDLVEQALLRGLEAGRRLHVVIELAELARGAPQHGVVAGRQPGQGVFRHGGSLAPVKILSGRRPTNNPERAH